MAAEFWFYSQLHRLGYETYITLGNAKSIDIIVKLQDRQGTTISFDVKSKFNFGGDFQYLMNVVGKENHFVVFTDLKTQKEKSGKHKIFGEPCCYIIKSLHLNKIAHNWTSPSGTKGFGFKAKYLWYLKHQDMKSITENNMRAIISQYGTNGKIDFIKYNKIILTLEDFENQFYTKK